MAEKLDFKRVDKALYAARAGRWDRLEVPALPFLMIDGQGDPGGPGYARALGALYSVAYAIKFALKARGADFVVPPLEALWWVDDPGAFVAGDRAAWRWTAMLRMPDSVTGADLAAAQAGAAARLAKKGEDAGVVTDLRLERFAEGDCLQTLHVGPYADEAPTLADLHDRLMPEQGLSFDGAHHEIYLSDPRWVAPDRLKTILRQPVKGA